MYGPFEKRWYIPIRTAGKNCCIWQWCALHRKGRYRLWRSEFALCCQYRKRLKTGRIWDYDRSLAGCVWSDTYRSKESFYKTDESRSKSGTSKCHDIRYGQSCAGTELWNPFGGWRGYSHLCFIPNFRRRQRSSGRRRRYQIIGKWKAWHTCIECTVQQIYAGSQRRWCCWFVWCYGCKEYSCSVTVGGRYGNCAGRYFAWKAESIRKTVNYMGCMGSICINGWFFRYWWYGLPWRYLRGLSLFWYLW